MQKRINKVNLVEQDNNFIKEFDNKSDYLFCGFCDAYAVLMTKEGRTHCVQCGANNDDYKYVNCNIMKIKRFDKLLRKMSIVTEEYYILSNFLRNKFMSLEITNISPLDVQYQLSLISETKLARNYPRITIIYSMIIEQQIKMSFVDKRLYKELFKHYIYNLDIKQINYPLVLGLIYYEINKSTLLEPEYYKVSDALIKSISEWNRFLTNLKLREEHKKYILTPIKLNIPNAEFRKCGFPQSIRLNDI